MDDDDLDRAYKAYVYTNYTLETILIVAYTVTLVRVLLGPRHYWVIFLTILLLISNLSGVFSNLCGQVWIENMNKIVPFLSI